MSEIQSAIVKALEANKGWISSLVLRGKLPADMRGEGFDFALQALTGAGRVSSRIDDIFKVKIYRHVPEAAGAVAPSAAAVSPASMARAVSSAFHPPPPALRVPLSGDPNEVKPPKPTTGVSHAKRDPEEKDMSKERKTGATKAQILQLLAKEPLRSGDLGERLGLTSATTSIHCKDLEREKKIVKQAGMRSPWVLVGGKAAAPAPATPVAASTAAGRAVSKRKAKAKRVKRREPVKAKRSASAPPVANGTGVQDLELKLQIIDQQAAKAGKIDAFVLREIREDLQRLAA